MNVVMLTAVGRMEVNPFLLLFLIAVISIVIGFFIIKFAIKTAINESDLVKEMHKNNQLLENVSRSKH